MNNTIINKVAAYFECTIEMKFSRKYIEDHFDPMNFMDLKFDEKDMIRWIAIAVCHDETLGGQVDPQKLFKAHPDAAVCITMNRIEEVNSYSIEAKEGSKFPAVLLGAFLGNVYDSCTTDIVKQSSTFTSRKQVFDKNNWYMMGDNIFECRSYVNF